MRWELDRRGFLGKLLGFLAAASGLGGCASRDAGVVVELPTAIPDLPELRAGEEEIVRRIEEAFPYLKLDPSTAAAFARDFVTYRDAGVLKPLPNLPLEDRFLLSSSFFDDGADESKTVEYVEFHDPWITPCSNRLARPAVEEDDDEPFSPP